ncbi:MAG: hypothetical protein R3B67_05440 [Phycisphaerales bacterium]
MHFNLVDRVIERSESHIVTLKHVSSAEEYLQDHFPGFPVLPGVMMLESMTQAARQLLDPDDRADTPWVLTQAKALKYGSFVRPGATIRVTMTRHKDNDDGSIDFKGDVRLIEPELIPPEKPPRRLLRSHYAPPRHRQGPMSRAGV